MLTNNIKYNQAKEKNNCKIDFFKAPSGSLMKAN